MIHFQVSLQVQLLISRTNRESEKNVLYVRGTKDLVDFNASSTANSRLERVFLTA